MNWAAQQRQEWIGESLRIFGYINREHLEQKFSISHSLAAKDIAVFIKNNPKAAVYNYQRKRYESPGVP